MLILGAKGSGRKWPRATCRGQGRDLRPNVLLGRVGAAEGHSAPSSFQPPGPAGSRRIRVSQEERAGRGWAMAKLEV